MSNKPKGKKTKTEQAPVTSERALFRPEATLPITGEEFLTLHYDIVQARNARMVLVNVNNNGTVLNGQGIAEKDLDLERMFILVEKIYKRFLDAGLGVDRDVLVKELEDTNK